MRQQKGVRVSDLFESLDRMTLAGLPKACPLCASRTDEGRDEAGRWIYGACPRCRVVWNRRAIEAMWEKLAGNRFAWYEAEEGSEG